MQGRIVWRLQPRLQLSKGCIHVILELVESVPLVNSTHIKAIIVAVELSLSESVSIASLELCSMDVRNNPSFKIHALICCQHASAL